MASGAIAMVAGTTTSNVLATFSITSYAWLQGYKSANIGYTYSSSGGLGTISTDSITLGNGAEARLDKSTSSGAATLSSVTYVSTVILFRFMVAEDQTKPNLTANDLFSTLQIENVTKGTSLTFTFGEFSSLVSSLNSGFYTYTLQSPTVDFSSIANNDVLNVTLLNT